LRFSQFLSHFGHKPCRIRGDGEKGFKGIADRLSGKIALQPSDDQTTRKLCTNEEYKRNVKFWLKDNTNSFHLTNSYTLVDSMIRVMRNLCGKDFSNRNHFFKVLDIYNNTVHQAFDNRFTPSQVQGDIELEGAYIRMKQRQLDDALVKQAVGGMSAFESGDLVLVHIPFEKTRQLFKKQRRNFSALARFMRYEGGNAVVTLLKGVPLKKGSRDNPEGLIETIAVPIFYVKIVAKKGQPIPTGFESMLPT
jgi:hypothetical protein